MSGRPGPVIIALPENMLTEKTDKKPLEFIDQLMSAPTTKDLAQFIEEIKEAKNPIVVLGGSIWSHKAEKDLMSISEMEEFIQKKHITLLPPTQLNIVSSTGSLDSKTDNGWKEVLSKVSEAHPASNLAAQYGKKSVKDTQVDRVIKTHRAKKAGKKV